MSGLVHILSNPPGCLVSEQKLSGVSPFDYDLFRQHRRGVSLRNNASSLRTSVICSVASNHSRYDPDFSRNKIFIRGKTREKGSNDNTYSPSSNNGPLQPVSLPSKNGPLQPPSSDSRFRSPVGPGKKEKEIVELFRKVQMQLRQRAKSKEKVETVQESPEKKAEKGTVESLLKLLRKHSLGEGYKSNNELYTIVEPEGENPYEEEQSSSSLATENLAFDENYGEENPKPVSTRPPSNFQRRSPVPRVKYQPVYSSGTPDLSRTSAGEKTKKKEMAAKLAELEPKEPVLFDDQEEEFEDEEQSDLSDIDEMEEEATIPDDEMEEEATIPDEMDEEATIPDEMEDDATIPDEMVDSSLSDIEDEPNEDSAKSPPVGNSDLESLTVKDLRKLAKIRGLQRYSSMKKMDLLKLLSRN